MNETILQIIRKYGSDPYRLMDILLDIQDALGMIPADSNQEIADELGMSRVDLEQTISFYHFFSRKEKGIYTVYLNNSVVANMMGREAVKRTFEEEAGTRFGNMTRDGLIGLYDTACIGMSDQEPAAIINGQVFNNLTPFRVREIVSDMRQRKEVGAMYKANYGDGQNSSGLVRSVVGNNIRRKGPVLWDEHIQGECIEKALGMNPAEVIAEIKHSNLRGRGGAGFPTGMKWEFCARSADKTKYLICNADEGEPGTFKDRVLLTEKPDLVFAGMVIAAYAIGAKEGILYLRHEYNYLKAYLESVLEGMRKNKLLGSIPAGKNRFSFDIRIQLGAGAYVCGEESALIESVEGKRGEPRDRPPFPVEKGYRGKPTVVNNVETLAKVAKIIKYGANWFHSIGTSESAGTKLLSISGDCRYPGVYEVEWGKSLYDILEMVGAEDCQAVQVGGPSGQLIGPDDFMRKLGYEDLATGGSLIIIHRSRDILKEVVLNFMEFFIDESCGSCSTCRNVPVLLKGRLEKIIAGQGVMQDIQDLEDWSKLLKFTRCGLGATAANPIITSIRNFRHLYEERVRKDREYDPGFNLGEAVRESVEATGRQVHENFS